MKGSAPPVLATWLMTRLALGDRRDSMIGDLIEQHRHGRSSAWYWRQATSAILTSVAGEIWQHRLLTIAVVWLGTCLDQIYM